MEENIFIIIDFEINWKNAAARLRIASTGLWSDATWSTHDAVARYDVAGHAPAANDVIAHAAANDAARHAAAHDAATDDVVADDAAAWYDAAGHAPSHDATTNDAVASDDGPAADDGSTSDDGPPADDAAANDDAAALPWRLREGQVEAHCRRGWRLRSSWWPWSLQARQAWQAQEIQEVQEVQAQEV